MGTTNRYSRSAPFAQPTIPEAEAFLGDELLSAPTTAGGTALASVPNGARHCFFQVTGNNVIFRPTGTYNGVAVGGNPDATHGILVLVNTTFDYTGDPNLLKFLGSGGTASVYVMYYGDVFP